MWEFVENVDCTILKCCSVAAERCQSWCIIHHCTQVSTCVFSGISSMLLLIAAICLTKSWAQQFAILVRLPETLVCLGAYWGCGGTFLCRKKAGGGGVYRKLLLSGSWGFVVLTHHRQTEKMVFLYRPESETQMGCSRPCYINTLQCMKSFNHRVWGSQMFSVHYIMRLYNVKCDQMGKWDLNVINQKTMSLFLKA